MGKPGKVTNLISPEELQKLLRPKKRQKFNARIVEFYGIKFRSEKEGLFYLRCVVDKKEKRIKDFETQVEYSLDVNGVHICKYYLDFLITHNDGSKEYVDTKGYKKGTVYKLFQSKKRLMKACHGIDVKEM